MPTRPELLAPAGSVDAVRAAVANGADAVYLGAGRFNARDDGAQLTLDELAESCRIAHGRGARIYLTLNTLVKTGELPDALEFLGECVDRGIDAVLVQDVGLITLIRRLYPSLRVHASTQMTVHDAAGARFVKELGVERVVLARENTLEDIRAIRAIVPDVGLETFVHGALCISYSGQCFMSGMISERSANRGSCAQSCRKDYVLHDANTGIELDRGYLISARDLGAYDHLAEIAEAGVTCLKIEGRKKKPEYVATVTKGYREFVDRVAAGTFAPPQFEEVRPLVQIFSRGFTGGMYGGRDGRSYVTRTHPDNHGMELGTVAGQEGGEIIIDVRIPVKAGDGLGFEPPQGAAPESTVGFAVGAVRTLSQSEGRVRQAVTARVSVPTGWRVLRTSDSALMESARASFARVARSGEGARVALDVRVFGSAGAALRAIFRTAEGETSVESDGRLEPAGKHALDASKLREQFGRLGETPFVLGAVDAHALGSGLFLPVSDLNRMRQRAIATLLEEREGAGTIRIDARRSAIATALSGLPVSPAAPRSGAFTLSAEVWRLDDAHAAADAGATEIVFDPFLRHPPLPRARISALRDELAARDIVLRLRTPTVVRPADRRSLAPWLALDLPMQTGSVGLVAEFGAAGRDLVADYAVNAFNPHSASEIFRRGARRITASVELTADELAALVAPWGGAGFDVVLYGRPEGMTIEHCVLSAAFDREPTTCRDLCIQKHPNVELTDPTGYVFPVATDSDCRNRLLHSRPIEGSEYLPRLWRAGIRGYRCVFNVAGDPVADLIGAYRRALDALANGRQPVPGEARAIVGEVFTRGHFARAV